MDTEQTIEVLIDKFWERRKITNIKLWSGALFYERKLFTVG